MLIFHYGKAFTIWKVMECYLIKNTSLKLFPKFETVTVKNIELEYFQSLSEEVKKHENAIKDLKQLTTDICIQVGDNKVIKMTNDL